MHKRGVTGSVSAECREERDGQCGWSDAVSVFVIAAGRVGACVAGDKSPRGDIGVGLASRESSYGGIYQTEDPGCTDTADVTTG